MKSMTWHSEPKDEKVNQYLDRANHAPYPAIFGISLIVLCSFTLLVLLGTF